MENIKIEGAILKNIFILNPKGLCFLLTLWKTFLLIPRAEIGSRQILLADKITNNFLILLSEYEYEYE